MTDKSDKSKAKAQVKHFPEDAQVIMAIMKDEGITDYDPRVINQLLEFTYRYVTTTLDEAKVYANHAKKKTIDLDDIRLAVQLTSDKSFTSPPPREVLLELARAKNVQPLPLIKPHCGPRLPPDRYCLSACNYRLKSTAKNVVPKPNLSDPSTSNIFLKPNTSQLNVLGKRTNTKVAKPPPNSVLRFTSNSKVVAKPAVRVVPGPQSSEPMEVDKPQAGQKRKRDPK